MGKCFLCGNFTNSILNSALCNHCKQIEDIKKNISDANFWSSINNIIAQDDVQKIENLLSALLAQNKKKYQFLPNAYIIEISNSLQESSKYHYDIYVNYLARTGANEVSNLNTFINLLKEKTYLDKSLVLKHIRNRESILSEAKRHYYISEVNLKTELSSIQYKLKIYKNLINNFGIEMDNINTHVGLIAFIVFILYLFFILFTDYNFDKIVIFFIEIIIVLFTYFGELFIISEVDKLELREREINNELFKKQIIDFLNKVNY